VCLQTGQRAANSDARGAARPKCPALFIFPSAARFILTIPERKSWSRKSRLENKTQLSYAKSDSRLFPIRLKMKTERRIVKKLAAASTAAVKFIVKIQWQIRADTRTI
jgi:hypothetical protein